MDSISLLLMLLSLYLVKNMYNSTQTIFTAFCIRFIPQGMVHNNIGPDRSAGPPIADNLCLKILTVHVNELRLFLGQGILPTHTINVAHLR